jgi:dephospho-CoA kinase
MQIAITGGIAEGKSTVLQFCSELGVPTLSADVLARDAFADPDIRGDVEELLGLPITDRAAIRSKILSDDQARRGLNQILHPWIAARARGFHGAIEIPLLIETVRFADVDAVVVVTCGEVEQRRRLMERLQDFDLTERMLAAQLPTRVKMQFADAVVRTNDSLRSVQDQTRAVLELLQWPEMN